MADGIGPGGRRRLTCGFILTETLSKPFRRLWSHTARLFHGRA
jgi:hypothetical protein